MFAKKLIISTTLAILVFFTYAFAADKTGKLSFEWTGSTHCCWNINNTGFSFPHTLSCDGGESKVIDLKPGSYDIKPDALWIYGKFFPSIHFIIKSDDTATVTPKVGQVAFYHAGKNPIWYVAMPDGSKETQVGIPGDHDLSSKDAVQTIDLPPGSYKIFYKLPASAYEVPGQEKYGTRIISVRDSRLTEVRP